MQYCEVEYFSFFQHKKTYRKAESSKNHVPIVYFGTFLGGGGAGASTYFLLNGNRTEVIFQSSMLLDAETDILSKMFGSKPEQTTD